MKRKRRPVAISWHPFLNAYADKKRLVFETDEEMEAAIDLLWTDALRALPHNTPDGRSLIVPAEAVRFFTQAGLTFTVREVPHAQASRVETEA